MNLNNLPSSNNSPGPLPICTLEEFRDLRDQHLVRCCSRSFRVSLNFVIEAGRAAAHAGKFRDLEVANRQYELLIRGRSGKPHSLNKYFNNSETMTTPQAIAEVLHLARPELRESTARRYMYPYRADNPRGVMAIIENNDLYGRSRRRSAELRATLLLSEFLSDEQRQSIQEHNRFRTTVAERIFEIETNYFKGNIFLLGPDGSRVKRYCIHPVDTKLPLADMILAQKVTLELDHARFLEVANCTAMGGVDAGAQAS
jgi:hypothetical protein